MYKYPRAVATKDRHNVSYIPDIVFDPEVKSNVTWPKIKAFPMNYQQRKACDKEIDELLAAEFIEECHDPSITAAGTFVLQKKVPVNAGPDYKWSIDL